MFLTVINLLHHWFLTGASEFSLF